MQFACMIGIISLEKEIVLLHCTSTGVTFSRVHEKSAMEQEEKVIKPTMNRAVIFIFILFTLGRDFKFNFHDVWNSRTLFAYFEIDAVDIKGSFKCDIAS